MLYIDCMPWVLVHLDEFDNWLEAQEEDLQDEALAYLGLLEETGPLLARPYADTLKGSKLKNLKELRFSYNGASIRIFFIFDPKQQGVILLGGDKTGNKRFYDRNIPIAETLYAQYSEKQKKEDEERAKEERSKKKEKGK